VAKKKKRTGFYAYPARPESIGETVQAAIGLSAKTQPEVRIRPWTKLNVSGRLIIDPITEAIDDADVFLCDVTYPNFNVMFELGYAVGRFKRIWLSLNRTIKDSEANFAQLNRTLIPVGYTL
jgi:hypothetical protein